MTQRYGKPDGVRHINMASEVTLRPSRAVPARKLTNSSRSYRDLIGLERRSGANHFPLSQSA